ncbi:hypothetical protein BZA05DRAFT_438031 [Tricharina praecox]|uniref:uncharacterized protein n=1 Tax=Tricharina praecox TaxID=43433 RepID=UPI00222001B2|nr:uncharacterized protein BZA05DRAFT_438031 [Tricharina praecox]KAI5846913.1 hypothetical protein BZA05DRAFT_438031 [Tricharina praecox]
MPASSSSDEDFARRLAALKSKPTPDDTASASSDDVLSARFAALFSRAPGSTLTTPPAVAKPKTKDTPGNPEDELDFSELVAGVQREKGRACDDVGAKDRAEIDALLEEAAGFAGEAEEAPEWLADVGVEEGEGEAEGAKGTGSEWDLKDEEDEILKKVREEVEWERRHGVVDSDEEEEEEEEEEDHNAHLKEERKEGDEDDDGELAALAARFKALGGGGAGGTGGEGGGGDLDLPAVPSVAPGSALRITPKKKMELPGISEIDTWCCICNEDAEYRCSGCDNDIYCKECLYEAHVGPQAGYEEKRHKWTKYVRPKKIISAQ